MYDKRSFLSGLAMGLCGKGDPTSNMGVTKKPIAYLYNGVQFPEIPVEEGLPYMYIDANAYSNVPGYDYWTLYLFDKPVRHGVYINNNTYFIIDSPCSGKAYFYTLDTESAESLSFRFGEAIEVGKWCYGNSRSMERGEIFISDGYGCLWANHDIINDDGSVYLAASEPIPVYE